MTTFRSNQQDARSEYFPSDSEQARNGNGNGHGNNGNGQKIFQLKPATDPDTLSILDARRDVLGDSRLTGSMKAYWCEILDRSLNPYLFDSKGVVTVSDKVIAEVFFKSRRTIYTWKRRVEECGHFWITAKYKSNMWPITTYHITALHPRRANGKTDKDGTYSDGKHRPAPQNPGLGARRPGQPGLPLAGSRQTPPAPKVTENQPISAESGHELRLSAEINCGSEPKSTSAESRNPLRATAEVNFGSEPKSTSHESRNPLRATAEADCEHIRDSVREKSLSERGGDLSPPDDAFQNWIKGLDKMLPSAWERLRAEFGLKVKRAKSAAARAALQAKLSAVEERLFGPPEPDDDNLPSQRASVRPIAERQPTPEEIAAGSAFMAEREKMKKAGLA